jgi:hypothetical protein
MRPTARRRSVALALLALALSLAAPSFAQKKDESMKPIRAVVKSVASDTDGPGNFISWKLTVATSDDSFDVNCIWNKHGPSVPGLDKYFTKPMPPELTDVKCGTFKLGAGYSGYLLQNGHRLILTEGPAAHPTRMVEFIILTHTPKGSSVPLLPGSQMSNPPKLPPPPPAAAPPAPKPQTH